MIRRVPFIAVLAALAAVGGGCDSDSSPTGPASHPLAGTWSGTISAVNNNLHCSMTPTEPAIVVRAEFVVDGMSEIRAVLSRAGGATCSGTGTIDGSEFSLRFDPCADLFTGTVTCFFDGWVGGRSGPVSSLDWAGSWSGTKVEGTGWARSTGAGGGAAGLRISVAR